MYLYIKEDTIINNFGIFKNSNAFKRFENFVVDVSNVREKTERIDLKIMEKKSANLSLVELKNGIKIPINKIKGRISVILFKKKKKGIFERRINVRMKKAYQQKITYCSCGVKTTNKRNKIVITIFILASRL